MSESFPHGFAVVMGVGADLPVTVTDATAIGDLLREPTRCAYPPDQVKLLTGDHARREHVLSALDWLAQAAGSDATATIPSHPAPGQMVSFGARAADSENVDISPP